MAELTSRVTSKGQVTIPIEVRRILRVSPHDQVAFAVEGDRVELKRNESVVARTAGILRGDEPQLTAEQLRDAAAGAIAEGAVERMGG